MLAGSLIRSNRSALNIKNNESSYQSTAYLIVAAQIVVTLLVAAVALLIAGSEAGYSSLVGGLTGFLPGYYLAGRVFRSRSQDPARIVRNLYTGEAVKLVMTAALFVVALLLLEVVPLYLFLAYLATSAVYWFALIASAK